MEYSSLYDLITYLQYGTKLHIGVCFWGYYGNEKCILPFTHMIHSGKICDEFKNTPNGLRLCYKCRNLAVKKAFSLQKPFSGFCINGVFEYTHPVIINGDVACIIFIGNIFRKDSKRLKEKLPNGHHLLNTLEKNFSLEQCEAVGSLLENYIRILIENVPSNKAEHFDPMIANIKNYIKTNLEIEINILQVAKVFHYNPQYMGRLFKEKTGMTFNDYVNKQRLFRAKLLLKETNSTVLSISNQLGFNNISYFNRIFKKHFGLTPTQYRTLQNEQT